MGGKGELIDSIEDVFYGAVIVFLILMLLLLWEKQKMEKASFILEGINLMDKEEMGQEREQFLQIQY